MAPYEHALVVGKFAPLHHGHQRLIEHAASIADTVTIICWSNPDFADMPTNVRADWIRQLYPDTIVLAGLDGPPNAAPDETQRAYTAELLARHGRRPDVVVTGESYGPALAEHLGATHVMFDPDRTRSPLSGTAIRADVHAHRQDLDPIVYAHFAERVVFLGAESTGKSTIAQAIAERMGTTWVAEYGRTYYEAHAGELGLDDYLAIAQEHRHLEDEAARRANRYVFVDTNAMTTLFFSHYYNRNSVPALRMLADDCRGRYRHVFVCDDDIPFEQDGWRDNEVWRARMQGMVLHDLAVRGIKYTLVTGPLEDRVAQVTSVLQHATEDCSGFRASTSPPPAAEVLSATAPPRPDRSLVGATAASPGAASGPHTRVSSDGTPMEEGTT